MGYFLINSHIFDDNSLVDKSGITELHPTPLSDISLYYSVKEIKNFDQYQYEFDFTFDIVQGIEPNFTSNGLIFNQTQLYISIKANYQLDFYTFFQILNMTEFQVDDSQVIVQKSMKSAQRLENLVINVQYVSISEGQGMFVAIGGTKYLFSKATVITTDDGENFSGTMHFWINGNSYNLSYSILSRYYMYYSLNSSVGDVELFSGYISIIGSNGTHSTGIGTISFPFFPAQPPGNYSSSSNRSLVNPYTHICFEFTVGIAFSGAEVEYEIIPQSEILDVQRKQLLKLILTSSGITFLVYLIVLGCMINQERKYDAFWYIPDWKLKR